MRKRRRVGTIRKRTLRRLVQRARTAVTVYKGYVINEECRERDEMLLFTLAGVAHSLSPCIYFSFIKAILVTLLSTAEDSVVGC